MQISITLALSKFSLSCASFTSLFVYLTFYPINLGVVEKLASFDIARIPYNNMFPHTLLGHSCKIGNMRLLGTPGIQNHQFHAICYFCLLFTLKQYIESRKYDGQPYCTFNQTSVPH